MTGRYRVEFTGEQWAVVDHAGRALDVFPPGARGARAARAAVERLNLPGVRTLRGAALVLRNAGFVRESQAAGLHERWVCGPAEAHVREEALGSVRMLIACPGWDEALRVPAGVEEQHLALLLEWARHSRVVRVTA